MAELERRLGKGKAARAEQEAKTDAILALVQSVGTSPRPASTHSAATRARENDSAHKCMRSWRYSGEETWVALPLREEGASQ